MNDDWMVSPLAQECVEVLRSDDPQRLFCYSPGIAVLDGRLIATSGFGGPGAADLPGPKGERGGSMWQGRVLTSDDGGRTWTQRTTFPFLHARPFVAGGRLCVLGHAGDLTIIASDDAGETWTDPVRLTDGQSWHQAPCNVHYASGCVYLTMERRTAMRAKGWPVSEMAPVLMRGRSEADLTRRENWTFASELTFAEAARDADLDCFGVPFYPGAYPDVHEAAPGRTSAPIGWLESNVVQFVDPDHIWHDRSGKTFHLWMRAHTGGVGFAAVARVVESDDGTMTTSLQTAPSGRTMLYVPCPGGQMKFHILYDEPSERFWLLSTQATDSMTRPDRLPDDRYNLPNNERRRLQLHVSTNCIDWCFAGLVAVGSEDRASRHYASMAIDGDTLHILSRSGDARARNPHDGNLITYHRIDDFRRLIY